MVMVMVMGVPVMIGIMGLIACMVSGRGKGLWVWVGIL